jgi:2-amino-4-hydroxy-6-hydroxymethyldihydropteridine diphosphokinase
MVKKVSGIGDRVAQGKKSPIALPTPHTRPLVLAYIGIGSNQGDRIALCREAVQRLGASRPGAESTLRIKKISSLYETEPMEYIDQDWFYNAVVEIETTLSPLQLLHHCQKIEKGLGKRIEIPKGPRTIDLDLLFYGQKVMSRPSLTLPHPAAAARPFVLIPLTEIAPKFVHPILHQTPPALLRRLTAGLKVEKKMGPGWENTERLKAGVPEEKSGLFPMRYRSRGR